MEAALTGQFDHLIERIIIIDCRYPYEFEGGHIKVRPTWKCVLINLTENTEILVHWLFDWKISSWYLSQLHI